MKKVRTPRKLNQTRKSTTEPAKAPARGKRSSGQLTQNWKVRAQSMSRRLISDYALPLTRMTENKLIQFQKQLAS